MAVREDEVINPGGGRNLYGHIHFKNRAVAILPLDDDGNTWLVGQQRYTLGAYSWELPMGGAPLEEAPEALDGVALGPLGERLRRGARWLAVLVSRDLQRGEFRNTHQDLPVR